MTLRVVQFTSIADQLDDLLILRVGQTADKAPAPRPYYGIGSKRCSCGATKSSRKEVCSNHPKKLRLL